ncbi:hypothetical protein CRG98_021773 [Punica granatum]|uniref:Uncharacterized protein n=1 Tax=Punica granatum TaxID=22663 RepID=A0A2I0JNF9_PUNGR|nr:hypothetical protein CRG98_021773 [Punica granatum]
MVNQLATNMATNMTELMAMLRNQNQPSSSFTPPPEHRPIVDPNPAVPPTLVSEVEDASFSAMVYTPTVHPISDPPPPPPAPTAVPLPPATLLFADSTMHTLPPLTVMTEMREGQAFEVYATEWRGKAAKHIPPIIERQQVQLFHSTLRGAYYSYLLAHTSSFSDLIEAGKKLDMGVKLGRIEGPSRKKDGETSKK